MSGSKQAHARTHARTHTHRQTETDSHPQVGILKDMSELVVLGVNGCLQLVLQREKLLTDPLTLACHILHIATQVLHRANTLS